MVDIPTFSEIVDLDRIEEEIDSWTTEFGIENLQGPQESLQHKNAFAHAYASAVIRYDHGVIFSRFLGNSREYRTFLTDTYKTATGREGFSLSGVFRDGHRDMYNNHIGNQIGQLAREYGLPRDALAYLVADAVETGKLVADEFNDERVGPLTFKTPNYSGPSPDVEEQIREEFGIDISADVGAGRRGRNRPRRQSQTDSVTSPYQDGGALEGGAPGHRGRNRNRRRPEPTKPNSSDATVGDTQAVEEASFRSKENSENWRGPHGVSASATSTYNVGLGGNPRTESDHRTVEYGSLSPSQAAPRNGARRQPLLELFAPFDPSGVSADGGGSVDLGSPGTSVVDGASATLFPGTKRAGPSNNDVGSYQGLVTDSARTMPFRPTVGRRGSTPPKAEQAIIDFLVHQSLPHL